MQSRCRAPQWAGLRLTPCRAPRPRRPRKSKPMKLFFVRACMRTHVHFYCCGAPRRCPRRRWSRPPPRRRPRWWRWSRPPQVSCVRVSKCGKPPNMQLSCKACTTFTHRQHTTRTHCTITHTIAFARSATSFACASVLFETRLPFGDKVRFAFGFVLTCRIIGSCRGVPAES